MATKIRILACATAIAAAFGGVAVTAGASDPTSAEQAAAAARAQEALPGAGASLSPAAHAGYRLTLSVSADAANALPGSDSPAFSAPPPAAGGGLLPLAELGWKAHMIGGVVAADDPQVVEFAVEWPGISSSDASLMTYRMRTEPGTPLRAFPRLGGVSAATASAQLTSSLDVLERVLGSAFERSRIVVVPIEGSANLFGVEADIRVTDLDAVRPYRGDVENGLATGLVGDETAVVEGLAVNLIDDQGRRAGWFRTERTGVGLGIVDPVLAGGSGAVHAVYPNLTGGPPTSGSVSGGPIGGPIGGPKPPPVDTVTLVPERAVGPVKLGQRRVDVEARLGTGERRGDWISVYRFRKVKLSVAYTLANRVREVRGSGGKLIAYGQRLSNEAAATTVLKKQGWSIRQCSPLTRIALHAKNGRFSGVVWQNHRLFQAGVSSIGSIGICLIGLPVSPTR